MNSPRLSRSRLAIIGFSLMAAFGIAQPAMADGDPAKGKRVFAKCSACHSIDDTKNRVGPHLDSVMNRKAGSVEDFKYSPAMIKAGEEGMVWDEETLTSYLAAPKTFIPGNKMAFVGLKKPEDIANLIAFIKSKTPE